MGYEIVGNTRFTLNGMGFQTIALTLGWLTAEWGEKNEQRANLPKRRLNAVQL
jgi:hypothetical protein